MTAAPDPVLHILHLEDERNDVELVQDTLETSGLSCRITHVDTREGFLGALGDDGLDLILSDFSLPAFDGFTALQLARERVPDVPFIFVSGTLGEEAAVDSLKRGATDYVLKQRLGRLVPAARRALEESAERRRRKEAEAGLRKEQQFLKVVLDSVEAGVVACDENGAFTLFNRAAREIHGLPDEPSPSERWIAQFELFQPDGITALSFDESPLLRALRGERLRNVELVIQPRSGPRRTVVASAQPIGSQDGRALGAVMAVHDITDRKRLEEQFRHAQKMDAVGRLAGGVAHDFNNILTVILGGAQVIESQLAPTDPLREDLAEIERAADRAATLTRQLLAFSRLQILNPRIIDLNAAVTEIEQMLRRLIGPDIELSTSLATPIGAIQADPGQVQQVILNLAVNARDAMPEGGRLALATREIAIDGAAARHVPDLKPGRYTVLEVSDTGVGMTEETRHRIFEPFFTTKEPGKGTGLGLSTVHGIVTQSGGHVEVESAPGRGTTLRIFLPVVDREPDAAHGPASGVRGPAPRGTGVVLVVEDEEPVRAYLRRTLESAGYDVLEARDGVEALETCETRRARIDLVITDVLMPRMRGTELAERLHDRRPDLKVLLISGYPDPALIQDNEVHDSAVLQKPFGPDTLLDRVRRMLERSPKAA